MILFSVCVDAWTFMDLNFLPSFKSDGGENNIRKKEQQKTLYLSSGGALDPASISLYELAGLLILKSPYLRSVSYFSNCLFHCHPFRLVNEATMVGIIQLYVNTRFYTCFGKWA